MLRASASVSAMRPPEMLPAVTFEAANAASIEPAVVSSTTLVAVISELTDVFMIEPPALRVAVLPAAVTVPTWMTEVVLVVVRLNLPAVVTLSAAIVRGEVIVMSASVPIPETSRSVNRAGPVPMSLTVIRAVFWKVRAVSTSTAVSREICPAVDVSVVEAATISAAASTGVWRMSP